MPSPRSVTRPPAAGRTGVDAIANAVDPLTKLPTGEAAIARARALLDASRGGLTLALFELDHVATMRQRFGDGAVDFVVGRLAAALRTRLRPGDVVGRVTPTRFLLALPAFAGARREHTVDLLRTFASEVPALVPRNVAPVSLSGGVAMLARKEPLAGGMRRAHRALVSAKGEGYGRVVVALSPAAKPLSGRPAVVS